MELKLRIAILLQNQSYFWFLAAQTCRSFQETVCSKISISIILCFSAREIRLTSIAKISFTIQKHHQTAPKNFVTLVNDARFSTI